MRILLTIAVLLAVPGLVRAQTGRIALFRDLAATQCNVNDGPGLFQVFVILVDHGGAGACDFKLEASAGFTATWQSDDVQFATSTGQSPTGIFIFFQSCASAPTHVLTANYFGTGTSATCSSINPVPNPIQVPERLSITDCVGTVNDVPGELIRVNPDAFCNCVVPVEETTWGHIKSVFQAP